jgi:hypothetical protein
MMTLPSRSYVIKVVLWKKWEKRMIKFGTEGQKKERAIFLSRCLTLVSQWQHIRKQNTQTSYCRLTL